MIPLTLLPHDSGSRTKRDRLELLTTLINAPRFDPVYRDEVIEIPPQHPVYGWRCTVATCRRPRQRGFDQFCNAHRTEWRESKKSGTSRAEFLRTATGHRSREEVSLGVCRICPDRPWTGPMFKLCSTHEHQWTRHIRIHENADFERWRATQSALDGFGICRVAAWSQFARSPVGLCTSHVPRYSAAGRPGGAQVQSAACGVSYQDEAAFRRWCETADPAYRAGAINLAGLRPLVKAELQWSLHAHAQMPRPTSWDLYTIQHLANVCRRHRIFSVFTLLTDGPDGEHHLFVDSSDTRLRTVCLEIAAVLRCIYYSPADTKEAGFIETDHFGRRFNSCSSHIDLTPVTQRWLRDLLWDYMAEVLQSPRCPRTRGLFDGLRRAAIELSAFLDVDAPEHGHDPTVLRPEHAQRFVADQLHRERHALPSLGLSRNDGKPSIVSPQARRGVFNHVRQILYRALEVGQAAIIGLDRGFITAIPYAGDNHKRSRNPFTDEVARALADEVNLQRFDDEFDESDRGLRDIWEAIIYTGRRCSEVVKLRLDCIGRYRGLPMLWHDQTKVGNYNEGIRIPETLYARLDRRRTKTLTRFEQRRGRLPTNQERADIALFPTDIRNPNEDHSISYAHFNRKFRAWVDGLDLGGPVAHQARHTLATNLLRAGATLSHIRRYLGQVSDRMAEHYTKIAHSDLEDVLHAVWVAGPGAPNPGELLSGESKPLTREEAMALALDISRRSTPADGGFCTFQPVVQGGACPWKLDCGNCDKFVLSGADLLYWRRKQEQWRSIAERAPDDATADYLHQVFDPTARAITGLEKALAGLGLLDEALAMDLRRPQDYFHRIWNTNFRATDLADIADDEDDFTEEQPA